MKLQVILFLVFGLASLSSILSTPVEETTTASPKDSVEKSVSSKNPVEEPSPSASAPVAEALTAAQAEPLKAGPPPKNKDPANRPLKTRTYDEESSDSPMKLLWLPVPIDEKEGNKGPPLIPIPIKHQQTQKKSPFRVIIVHAGEEGPVNQPTGHDYYKAEVDFHQQQPGNNYKNTGAQFSYNVQENHIHEPNYAMQNEYHESEYNQMPVHTVHQESGYGGESEHNNHVMMTFPPPYVEDPPKPMPTEEYGRPSGGNQYQEEGQGYGYPQGQPQGHPQGQEEGRGYGYPHGQPQGQEEGGYKSEPEYPRPQLPGPMMNPETSVYSENEMIMHPEPNQGYNQPKPAPSGPSYGEEEEEDEDQEEMMEMNKPPCDDIRPSEIPVVIPDSNYRRPGMPMPVNNEMDSYFQSQSGGMSEPSDYYKGNGGKDMMNDVQGYREAKGESAHIRVEQGRTDGHRSQEHFKNGQNFQYEIRVESKGGPNKEIGNQNFRQEGRQPSNSYRSQENVAPGQYGGQIIGNSGIDVSGSDKYRKEEGSLKKEFAGNQYRSQSAQEGFQKNNEKEIPVNEYRSNTEQGRVNEYKGPNYREFNREMPILNSYNGPDGQKQFGNDNREPSGNKYGGDNGQQYGNQKVQNYNGGGRSVDQYGGQGGNQLDQGGRKEQSNYNKGGQSEGQQAVGNQGDYGNNFQSGNQYGEQGRKQEGYGKSGQRDGQQEQGYGKGGQAGGQYGGQGQQVQGGQSDNQYGGQQQQGGYDKGGQSDNQYGGQQQQGGYDKGGQSDNQYGGQQQQGGYDNGGQSDNQYGGQQQQGGYDKGGQSDNQYGGQQQQGDYENGGQSDNQYGGQQQQGGYDKGGQFDNQYGGQQQQDGYDKGGQSGRQYGGQEGPKEQGGFGNSDQSGDQYRAQVGQQEQGSYGKGGQSGRQYGGQEGQRAEYGNVAQSGDQYVEQQGGQQGQSVYGSGGQSGDQYGGQTGQREQSGYRENGQAGSQQGGYSTDGQFGGSQQSGFGNSGQGQYNSQNGQQDEGSYGNDGQPGGPKYREFGKQKSVTKSYDGRNGQKEATGGDSSSINYGREAKQQDYRMGKQSSSQGNQQGNFGNDGQSGRQYDNQNVKNEQGGYVNGVESSGKYSGKQEQSGRSGGQDSRQQPDGKYGGQQKEDGYGKNEQSGRQFVNQGVQQNQAGYGKDEQLRIQQQGDYDKGRQSGRQFSGHPGEEKHGRQPANQQGSINSQYDNGRGHQEQVYRNGNEFGQHSQEMHRETANFAESHFGRQEGYSGGGRQEFREFGKRLPPYNQHIPNEEAMKYDNGITSNNQFVEQPDFYEKNHGFEITIPSNAYKVQGGRSQNAYEMENNYENSYDNNEFGHHSNTASSNYQYQGGKSKPNSKPFYIVIFQKQPIQQTSSGYANSGNSLSPYRRIGF